ncbi:hypothetical protein KSX_54600 [Ktedonospora formicarum]|uniref:Uncharacterized protein n=1 Tax=Ktedonospora formicarum TaxID=2778364 RepID=A0A8J3HZU0_9CHLR|nr:hypothetical protein KSX_54600 [Ktedonospora formicarum]
MVWLSLNGKEKRMRGQEERSHEHDQEARACLVRLMQMGYSWQKAQAQVELRISRSTAYRL